MIKIHVLHTGEVCVSPNLPFGGDNMNLLKASGIFEKKSNRLWLPVSSYLIEHPKGIILVDCGWNRDLSPVGEFDKKAQIKSLGSRMLYKVNQGVIPKNMAIDEQLSSMGITTSDIDYVLVTHLDCDHANGLPLVSDAKNILAASEELTYAKKHSLIRFQKKWYKNVPLKNFEWSGTEGPFRHSYDLFGDGSIVLIHIPGHSEGLFAVKITGDNGNFILLVSDGGYSKKSWEEMILPGISLNKIKQKKSLEWIKKQSMNELCVKVIASHDRDIAPQMFIL